MRTILSATAAAAVCLLHVSDTSAQYRPSIVGQWFSQLDAENSMTLWFYPDSRYQALAATTGRTRVRLECNGQYRFDGQYVRLIGATSRCSQCSLFCQPMPAQDSGGPVEIYPGYMMYNGVRYGRLR